MSLEILKRQGHGGKRAGAGKKPGTRWLSTLEKQAAHDLYRETVLKKFDPVVRAQVEAATGQYAAVSVVELTDGGLKLRRVTDEQELAGLVEAGKGFRIALHEPDMTISKYLTDQVVGKASEHVEVTGPNRGPVLVKFVEASV